MKCDSSIQIGYGANQPIPGTCHGSLAHTGLDIGLMVVVALALVAMGFLIRRYVTS